MRRCFPLLVRSMVAAAATRAPARRMRTSAAAVLTPLRSQSSLQSLLNDTSDPYCAAVQELDIPRISRLLLAGPGDTACLPLAHHHRPTPAPSPAAQDGSQAAQVLQTIYHEGLKKRAEAMEAEQQEAQAAYDVLSEGEKAALRSRRVVQHTFDGVCATIAVLRSFVEDCHETETPAAVAAALEVFCFARAAYVERGLIPPEAWRDDFYPEMSELAELLARGKCSADLTVPAPAA